MAAIQTETAGAMSNIQKRFKNFV